MKKYLKNLDISSKEFCKKAVDECFKHKTSKQMKRKDIVALFEKYKTRDAIAEAMSGALKKKELNLPQVKWDKRVDKSNNKVRDVGIEDIWMQLFDYVAWLASMEMVPMLGHYQHSCIKGRGCELGKAVIAEWLAKGDIREIRQFDIVHNYATTSHERMLEFLERHTRNDAYTWLVGKLLSMNDKGGLIIGSVLSVILNALYLSQAYHEIEGLYRVRHHKNGVNERIPLVGHVFFNVDDFAIYCTSAKNAEMATKRIVKIFHGLGYELHEVVKRHPTEKSYQDILGYRIYTDHVTMRHRNYVKIKKSISDFRKRPTLKHARTLISRYGYVKHTNSVKFKKKYNSENMFIYARRKESEYGKFRRGKA